MAVSMRQNSIRSINATGEVGFAYVIKIGDTGKFKIGHSDDPDARIATFGTIATEPLSWYSQIPSTDPDAIEKVMKDYIEGYRVPGLEARELFEPPLAELDEAIAVAREWNKAMLPDIEAVKLLKAKECDPELTLEPTEEHWADYRELVRLRQIERRAQLGQTRILTRWQLHMDRASSLGLIATWKHHYTYPFDKKGFLKKYPHLAPFVDEFTAEKLVRRFLPHW
jgi:hypothetical protein